MHPDKRLQEKYTDCNAFYRDASLPEEVLDMYPGRIIFQETTFCDSSISRGGMVTNNRKEFSYRAAQDFAESVAKEPIPDFNSEDLLDRIMDPLGIIEELDYVSRIA